MQRVIIISGASRGLGLALAKQLADDRTHLISIARHNNPELAAWCAQQKTSYRAIMADLALPNGAHAASQHLQEALSRFTNSHAYWLINNAGTVNPMAQSHQLLAPHAIAHALQLNIGSLMSLSATFLAHSPSTADRRILNISSGAGRGPVPGWGVYGATKAAVDYYSQTLAMEHPQVKCVALAPGVVDTDMQATIRQSEESHFPNRARFIQLHQNQQLASASFTAEHIARYLADASFGHKTIDDIRHYF